MAAHCGLVCYIYLLVLSSIVASHKLKVNSSYKYTAEVQEDSSLFNFKDICDQVPYGILKCSRKQSISVLTCNCVTYDDTEYQLQVGTCSFNINNHETYTTLPALEELNEFMCKEWNREGTLCGNCNDSHYPLAYSYNLTCVECPDGKSNWWKYLLAAFLPLTAFCFVVLLFKINVTSSYLQGFVVFSQVVSIPLLVRVITIQSAKTGQYVIEWPLRVLITLYGIWNLDFMRSMQFDICLGTDTLQTLALDLAVGVYPLLLMMLSYLLIDLYDRNFRPLVIMWKPFSAIFGLFERNWDVRTSLIDAFAAFLVLSSMKFLSTSWEILAPVYVYQLNNSTGNLSYSWRVFYNASLPYFGEEHLPYGVLAMAVLLLFVFLPTLLLIFYPFCWFHKFMNLFPVRWYVLTTFIDSFQGCYKNGTQPGSRDYRWFASAFFILRILLLLISTLAFNAMFFPLVSMLLGIYIIALLTLEPFKESHQNNTYALFLCNLALALVICIRCTQVNLDKMVPYLCLLVFVVVLPLLYVSAITLHWMYRHRKFGSQLIRKLSTWWYGYETLN